MKKILVFLMIFLIIFSFNAYGQTTKLFEIRNKFFGESLILKSLLAKSADAVYLSVMFDSCLLTISQIDAYLSMVGIVESVKKEAISPAAYDFMVNWLSDIKNTDNLSLSSLAVSIRINEKKTGQRIEKLKEYFSNLNALVDAELTRVTALINSLNQKRGR